MADEKLSEQTEFTGTIDGDFFFYVIDGTTPYKIKLSKFLEFVAVSSVSPSSGTITFDFLDLHQRTFKTTLSTENVTTLAVSNATNEVHLYWLLDVTGTCNITLPVGSVLNEDNLPSEMTYTSGTRVLAIAAGTNDRFNLSRIKDGSTYEWVIAKTST